MRRAWLRPATAMDGRESMRFACCRAPVGANRGSGAVSMFVLLATVRGVSAQRLAAHPVPVAWAVEMAGAAVPAVSAAVIRDRRR